LNLKDDATVEFVESTELPRNVTDLNPLDYDIITQKPERTVPCPGVTATRKWKYVASSIKINILSIVD
jgi:hypothetical protein